MKNQRFFLNFIILFNFFHSFNDLVSLVFKEVKEEQ